MGSILGSPYLGKVASPKKSLSRIVFGVFREAPQQERNGFPYLTYKNPSAVLGNPPAMAQTVFLQPLDFESVSPAYFRGCIFGSILAHAFDF